MPRICNDKLWDGLFIAIKNRFGITDMDHFNTMYANFENNQYVEHMRDNECLIDGKIKYSSDFMDNGKMMFEVMLMDGTCKILVTGQYINGKWEFHTAHISLEEFFE